MFSSNPKVKIVEAGRVGLRKKKISHPEKIPLADSVDFVQAELATMGLNDWTATHQEGTGLIMKAYITSPAGNTWRVIYGTDDGNMVFVVDAITDQTAVTTETEAIRTALTRTLGFL